MDQPAVIVDTTRSPHAALRPVPVDAVRFTDGFWRPRQAINRAKTIPGLLRLLHDTGRIANFRRAAGREDGPYQGMFFNDSDVYKWIEAAAWELANAPDPELERQIDETIAEIEPAQRADGYLNTYFARERADERWTNFDLHEMYCAGHLFQAAVALHRTTGSDRLLRVATRLADHIDATFGPGKRRGTDGHPEVELALVELGRCTGERRYVELARFLLAERGHGLLGNAYGRYGSAYHQDHRPFVALEAMAGHAVRAVYLNAGAADLVAELGDEDVLAALGRLWADMTGRRMYASGGIGSRYIGEAFGDAYELPNRLAYTETCAAVGSIMWNWRMFLLEGEARYFDLLEHTLFNAVLPGVSLDGERFFYQNPLADDGHHRRAPWFEVACCPPNVARLLAQLPGYAYAVAEGAVWVNLYAASEAALTLPDGRRVAIRQETGYPWDGRVELAIEAEGEFALHLRVPAHAGQATVAVNGGEAVSAAPGIYAELRRTWAPGDRVTLSLELPVRRVQAHPYVTEDRGQLAFQRGPILYCAEAADHPGLDVRDLRAPEAAALTPVFGPELLGGVTVLHGETTAVAPTGWDGRLYRDADAAHAPDRTTRVAVTLVPYFAWANREPGAMRVWLPRH